MEKTIKFFFFLDFSCIFMIFLFEKLNFGEKIEIGFSPLLPDPDLDPYGEFPDPYGEYPDPYNNSYGSASLILNF